MTTAADLLWASTGWWSRSHRGVCRKSGRGLPDRLFGSWIPHQVDGQLDSTLSAEASTAPGGRQKSFILPPRRVAPFINGAGAAATTPAARDAGHHGGRCRWSAAHRGWAWKWPTNKPRRAWRPARDLLGQGGGNLFRARRQRGARAKEANIPQPWR